MFGIRHLEQSMLLLVLSDDVVLLQKAAVKFLTKAAGLKEGSLAPPLNEAVILHINALLHLDLDTS